MSLKHLGAAALASLAFGLASPAQASDHLDGIKTAIDISADITDLFSFVSPRDPNKLVLILNVHAFAGGGTMFSNAVDYKLRVRPIADKSTLKPSASREATIVCNFTGGGWFDSTQQATCTLNLASGTETISFSTRGGGYRSGGEGYQNSTRIFAGVRSNPWFLDLGKTVKVNEGFHPSGPGSNGLQGTNVLSIVVEVDKAKLPGPLLAISGQTVRK